MRYVVTILLSLPCIIAAAQEPCQTWFDFDPGDTLYQKYFFLDTANHNNIWQVGKPSKSIFVSAYDPPNALVTDTLNPYPPNDTSAFIIKTPQWRLIDTIKQRWGFAGELYITHQLDLATGDSAYIDLSLDSGITWYPVKSSVSQPLHFGGSSNGWAGQTMNLAHGSVVSPDALLYVRFRIKSGATASSNDGWMIDNMYIGYWCESLVPLVSSVEPVKIYPNPSDGRIAIKCTVNSTGSLQMYTPEGRKIYETMITGTDNIQLSVPRGLYLLQYTSAQQHITERIIIR